MADNEENERSYNVMERLLFYTLPVLFTLLLTGVLLTVFGYDVTNELLRGANKIPFVSEIVPDPRPTDEELQDAIRQAGGAETASDPESRSEDVARFEALIAERDAQIAQLSDDNAAKDEQLAELQAENEELRERYDAVTVSDEQYTAQIAALAQVYAEMSASKAAPVLESLTLAERVLVLSQMDLDAQVSILGRMNPQIAAETSILMKDTVPARDEQIAALQSRLAIRGSAGGGSIPAAQLTKEEVSQTFASMAPNRAASVLLEMAKTDRGQVVSILQAMDEAPRASLLNALADLSEEETAKITARLG